MEAGHELVDTRPDDGVNEPLSGAAAGDERSDGPGADALPAGQRRGRRESFVALVGTLRRPAAIYFATRAALFVLAVICEAAFGSLPRGNNLSRELANWDGEWYVRLAQVGYPAHVSHGQTTLGFFPCYSMLMWLVGHVFDCSYLIAGLLISGIGGFVAVVLIERLVKAWWGAEVARKSVLLFCLFPGSVVFSMDYSEGLLIPLIAGVLLALTARRYLLAGLLAGLASGVGPDALVVVPTCAATFIALLHRLGWRSREAWRSFVALALSPLGAVGFAIFCWVWTGSPLASFTAQHNGWNETTTPAAIPLQVVMLVRELRTGISVVNLNVPVGLLGTVFLVFGLIWLWQARRTLPLEAVVFIVAISFLMVTSLHVPPNPRLLITGFPVVLIYARRFSARGWQRLIYATGCSCVLLSVLTFVGRLLRP